MSATLPVHELFHSFQGEGVHAGRSAFFIRLFGCPVQCPWCDSAGTWHPKHIPKDIQRMSVSAIADQVRACAVPPEFVVVTGGEPCIHELWDLNAELEQLETRDGDPMDIHLETSGSFSIRGIFDWITLSPKRWKAPLPENLDKADEFKVIVEHPDDIAFYSPLVVGRGEPVWLHPEWSHREDPAVLNAITNAVVAGGGTFRAGWQMHKPYRADLTDNRTRPAVPLGGDLSKGF